MSKLFLNLPLPVGVGPGASVNTSALSSPKTLTCIGSFAGSAVLIEASVDGGVTWAPVVQFQNTSPDSVVVELAAQYMRTNVSGAAVAGVNCDVAAEDTMSSFAPIPLPVGIGAGAAVNVTTFGQLMTFIIGGLASGSAVQLQISEDGLDWATIEQLSVSKAIFTKELTTKFVRAFVTGKSAGGATLAVGAVESPEPLQPAFQSPPLVVTIYARTTGSDTTGDGKTIPTAYLTFQRAVRDVPSIIPPGVTYVVDITGITEALPNNYELPCWRSSLRVQRLLAGSNPYWTQQCAVAIQATPQLVAAIPAADAMISAAEFAAATVTVDPITGMRTIDLNVSRPSWAANALKGKQLIDGTTAFSNCTIVESSNAPDATIKVTSAPAPSGTTLTAPFRIMEPSAHLITTKTAPFGGGLNAIDIDSIAFDGIRISCTIPAQTGVTGGGAGFIAYELCALENPAFGGPSLDITNVTASHIFTNSFALASTLIAGYSNVQDTLIDGVFIVCLRNIQTQFLRTVINACNALVLGTFAPLSVVNVSINRCRIANAVGEDGFRFRGGFGNCLRTDFAANAGAGVLAVEGLGLLELFNCGTSAGQPNGTEGVRVDDGIFVATNADTDTTKPGAGLGLRGVTDMRVGDLPARTWLSFTTIVPLLQEYDITAVGATGAIGTGSRLFRF